MLGKLIQSLRILGFIEGLSWLALIGAMIYRAITGHHDPVSWAGRMHGGLFTLFAVFLVICWIKGKWNTEFTFLIGLSSLVPLGFFFADPHLKKKQEAAAS